jgi:hypothetical protein
VNSFLRHHQDSIRFSYSCFDRLILNGGIGCFQHSKRGGTIRWFLENRRHARRVCHAYFTQISGKYHEWIADYAHQQALDIVEPPKKIDGEDVRREQWVEPYFQKLGSNHGVAVILKARESERIAWHYAKANSIEVAHRFVNLYYFYIHDAYLGRMFLRICPYFPFNIRVWINGHNWLAAQMQGEGIAFQKRDNLFTACAEPERLQELADAFAPGDILAPVEAWLAQLLPFFSAEERQDGFRHQLRFAQVEYCHNVIFHKQADAQRLFGRLLDANHSLGHPDKLAVVFGRSRCHPDTRTGQTVVKITKLRTPVISSGYQHTSIKQYVSNGAGLRTESASYNLKKDLSINKDIQNLAKVRQVLDQANNRYLEVQQDVLASYVDRGQLQQLRQPSISPTGRRVPGLHIDDPRLMAVLQAILCFAYLVGKGCFRIKDLIADAKKALGDPDYTVARLRYDLSKLRGKGMVTRLPRSQCYQISADGYRIGFFYLKLYQKMYAPLTSAILAPVAADNYVLTRRQTKLDQLYVAADNALQRLTEHLGMAA